MKRKGLFLTLAIAPGLLVGAGAKIVGSKSPDAPVATESSMRGTTTAKSTMRTTSHTHRRHRHKRIKSTGTKTAGTKNTIG